MSNFLQERHDQWKELKEVYEYSWDNYTVEYAKHDRVELYQKRTAKLRQDKYLHQKVQAETEEAYWERILTSDPISLFPTAVDSLNGVAYAKEDETVRDFGDLGRTEPYDENDQEYQSTTAYKLWHNVDGKGTNWLPLMKQMGIKQTVLHRVWGLVDGIKERTYQDEGGNDVSEVVGEASIHVIDPAAVVNWYPDTNPTQVLVKESTDMRSSIYDEASRQETYMLYTLDGWERWVDDESPYMIDSGEYEFYDDRERTKRILPIFPVEMPMPRNVGYLLAMKQNHLYNAKSIRDFSVRNMSFATLVLSATSGQYNEFIDNIKKGYRVIREDPENSGSHRYIAPPSDYLSEAAEILEKDKEDFLESAFKIYGDAAKQATATQIMHESRTGAESFLNLLVTSLDEFENHCFWLLEQIYFPNEPNRWGKAYVKRATDFTPKDIDEAMTKRSNIVRNAMQVNAMSIKRAVEVLNPEYTPEEVDEEVQMISEQMGAVELPGNMVGA